MVRTGRQTVLIETGIGNKQSPKMQQIHQNQALLPASLAAAGVGRTRSTSSSTPICTSTTAAGTPRSSADGSVTPTFPNARYFAHAGEVAHGHLQLDRDRVSYLSPNYDPLIESGQMTLLDDAGDPGQSGDMPGDFGGAISRAHGAHDGRAY